MQSRASLQELTDKRDALQTELVELQEEKKKLLAEKNKDEYGGWREIKEHEAFEKKIEIETPKQIARHQALIEAAKENQAILEAHKENMTKNKIAAKIFANLRDKEKKGHLPRKMVDDEIKLISDTMGVKVPKEFQSA